MSVARLIIRPYGTAVEDEGAAGLEAPDHAVSRFREYCYWGLALDDPGIRRLCHGQQLSGRASSTQHGVVEQWNLAIRMQDASQESRHRICLLQK